ncbi:hypothetical protein, partial [Brevundimonas sp.]|uniref:hypothetical protein n=1 Tax=Brevundimonas sp. TaxID=1871086 RepID=UPI0037844C6A
PLLLVPSRPASAEASGGEAAVSGGSIQVSRPNLESRSISSCPLCLRCGRCDELVSFEISFGE